VLSRAQETLEIVLSVLGQRPPVSRDQALNERHYGDLQGLNKKKTAECYGAEQVKLWRRSYDVPPPNGEALKNTADRTLPFFERAILGDLQLGNNVLVVAHGNSNRSIVMKLDGLTGTRCDRRPPSPMPDRVVVATACNAEGQGRPRGEAAWGGRWGEARSRSFERSGSPSEQPRSW
jgi:broad specificity phosphatase PhoE